MNGKLLAFELWMVRANVRDILDHGVDAAERVASLRMQGYMRVANAVEEEIAGRRRVVFAQLNPTENR